MPYLTIDVPEGLATKPGRAPEDIAREVRLAAAIEWYRRGEISMERAAQIAGLDRADFLNALSRGRVEVFPVDLGELKEELRRGLEARHQRFTPDPPEPGRTPGDPA